MARVLFVSDQWGYGTTTIAMAIAGELAGSATRVFAGAGPGFELARRGEFEEFVATDTMTRRPSQGFQELVRESDVVLSVMNTGAAWLAEKFATPCVYVDSLLWMWQKPPHVPQSICRYFVEVFPRVEERVSAWRDLLPELQVVSPIIESHHLEVDKRTDLLVNFGGLTSWLMDQQILVDYARVMIESVDIAFQDWPGKIVVAAGPHVLNRLEPTSLTLSRSDIRFASLSHSDYLAQLDKSRMLVSSPGFHAMSEAFARGVPSVVLPAHNLSQTFTLQSLELAMPGSQLDWDKIYGPQGLTATDEEWSCARIEDCIQRLHRDPGARRSLVLHLRSSATCHQGPANTGPQAAFFSKLTAEPGAQTIGRFLKDTLAVSKGPTAVESELAAAQAEA